MKSMNHPTDTFLPLGILFEKIERLPSVPKLYTDLVALMDDPESSLEAIGRVISKDMAMTAMILKTVNSAAFGLKCHVANATEAASHLGVSRIRVLALSFGIFSQFKSISSGRDYIETIWLHSIRVATTARTIAQMEGCSELVADEAFAAGLLHDIGKLVLADNFAEQYTTVLKLVKKEKQLQYRVEDSIFGANHADVGGRILLNWQLPLPIAASVLLHHVPHSTGQQVFGPLTAVHAANAFEHNLQDGPSHQDRSLDIDYLSSLGAMARLPCWRTATRVA